VVPERNAAAFFDLDKTLMAGSSGMEFARVARNHGLISRRQMIRWGIDHFRYRLEGATDEQTAEVLKVARETVADVPVRQIARMLPEVLAGILPRIYPEMLAEVHRHQDEGRQTWIVSAAGHEMVETLAGILGMEGGVGTRYHLTGDGTYSGDIDGPFIYGQGKVEAIVDLAERHELDLSNSWAYSDSVSDLPMLEAVGHAVVVNPDARLNRVAREHGWEVMRFERLGRNLAVAASLLVAALLGGVGSYVSSRR
jgi:HAD superfamily hydrolase (TIGR01490 family)